MIEGTVNASYEAIVPLRLHGADGQTLDISAVVDTGYTGYLTLPQPMVAALELPFASFGRAILADDSEVAFDVHYITIAWDGQPREIEADASGSTPLVGMLLLDGHDLSIQIRQGGRVLIQAPE